MRHPYQTLASQLASAIETDILTGKKTGWLPGERSLSETHRVSRKTLRKALRLLQEKHLVEAHHGIGYKILPENTGGPSLPVQSDADCGIGLLTPQPVESLRPYTALWVGELGAMLAENGERLRVFSGKKYFSGTPARALQRLVAQHPQRCWLLSHSNVKIQQWFAHKKIPCIITGTADPEINLPSIDLDHRAVCRHAAGVLLRLGHRRIAFVNERSNRVGDSESEAGFTEGMLQSQDEQTEPVIGFHNGTISQVCRLVDRLLASARPPTAFFVVQPLNYLTIATHLARRGLRIPEDISMMCRDDDGFMEHLCPAPARYACRAPHYARKLLGPVLTIASGSPLSQRVIRLFPDYIEGGSLARLSSKS